MNSYCHVYIYITLVCFQITVTTEVDAKGCAMKVYKTIQIADIYRTAENICWTKFHPAPPPPLHYSNISRPM